MKKENPKYFLGLDVQIKRACPYYVISDGLDYIDSGWLAGNDNREVCLALKEVIQNLEKSAMGQTAVGIDAPRVGLEKPRDYYWKKGKWTLRTTRDRGHGRHCEVVIRALNMGYPQWTPLRQDAPDWMVLGFDLFHSLSHRDRVFEVFPSASYRLLEDKKEPLLPLSLHGFSRGPKDMLDACTAALTVHQFMHGEGSEVGGGDGLGTIILPTELPIDPSHPVLDWPGKI